MKWCIFILITFVAACSQDEVKTSEATLVPTIISIPDNVRFICEYPAKWSETRKRCVTREDIWPNRVFPLRRPDLKSLKNEVRDDQTFQCEIGFSADIRGRVYNIVPECADSSLNDAAEEVIAQLLFAPRIVQGKAYERPAVDCCIAGKAGSDDGDTFYCVHELAEAASACEIAPKATQD